ncbi:large conductance mechanosensitive channel protein MscL [Asaccharospora irregularis]|uniref:Large-conductance mechanosensitive channel n=1 Tax=Asaccharospora irregularis DSM 2635 TaxID=1121321 RepID=A0A1M5L036_9FIRM|nr:large conductance mechanosensitive channel protein MscL [Asaccharospora irregularis]SHG58129.1 large conductance mechanosensitive channel [Asaccharospora irregularis DSM 2635]
MKKIFEEFKNFAMRGKVIDLAIGVVIGNTFSKFISSAVSDVIMPILSLIVGDINYKEYTINIGANNSGILIGRFIDNIINLILVTAVLFAFVKVVNRLREGQAVSLKGDPKKPEDIALLEEIRDLLKGNQTSGNKNTKKQ